MPVREISRSPKSEISQSLLKELISELRNPHDKGQPMIVVQEMSRNGLHHIYVFWDCWQDCPAQERGEVIREAFKNVKGDAFEKTIALPIGATIPEGEEMGLLPFEIKNWWYVQDKGSDVIEKCKRAMIEEGASVLKNPDQPQLLFFSEEDAKTTLQRLQQAVPGPYWGLFVHS